MTECKKCKRQIRDGGVCRYCNIPKNQEICNECGVLKFKKKECRFCEMEADYERRIDIDAAGDW